MRLNKVVLTIGLIVASLGLDKDSQGQVVKNNEDEPIKVETRLVNLPLIVSERGSPLKLTKNDFKITQGGEARTIEFFSDTEGPMSVSILVDVSGSTMRQIGKLKRAAIDFITLFRPEDKGMIVSFGTKTRIICDFTSDQEALRKCVNKLQNYGGSNMNDAISQVISKGFPDVSGKKAIIILTDGMVSGGVSNDQLLETVANSDVMVYPVLFLDIPKPKSTYKGITDADFLEGIAKIPQYAPLDAFAKTSGGRLVAAWLGDFDSAFQSIAAELKKQYVIGFYPSERDGAELTNLSIQVTRPGVSVRTKQSVRVKLPNTGQ